MALSHKYLADRYARQAWEDSQPENGKFWYIQATAVMLEVQQKVGGESYLNWYWIKFPVDPPTSRELYRAICQQYRAELLAELLPAAQISPTE